MFVEKSIWSRGRKIALAIVITLTLGALGIKAGADNNWLGSASLAQVRVIIGKLSDKNTELSAKNTTLYNEYQKASQDLANNQSTVTDLNNQVSRLKQQLDELNNTVATMGADKQQALDDKQKEVDAKQKEVDAKQKEVDALNAKLQNATANDEQLQKALADANETKDVAQKALENAK